MYFKWIQRYLCICIALWAGSSFAQSADPDWQGPYAGFHLGGSYADFRNNSPARPGPSGDDIGAVGGIQLGYNWQRGDLIYGTEVDFSLLDHDSDLVGGQFEEDMMTSLRLRAGQVVGDTLVYGSFGVAWTATDSSLTGQGTDSDYQPGFILGGGVEQRLGGGISGRVEAYYVDVPTNTQDVNGTATSSGSQNLILRAGLNLHF